VKFDEEAAEGLKARAREGKAAAATLKGSEDEARDEGHVVVKGREAARLDEEEA